MAKKTTAKPTQSANPAAAPAIFTPAPTPAKRLIATRPSESRLKKAAPATKAIAPAPAAPVVTAKPKAKATHLTRMKPAAKAPVAPPTPPAKRSVPAVAKPRKKAPALKPSVPSYTHDDIAVRAYLISERRQQEGWHAEPHENWAEAERQLHAEFLKGAK